MYTTISILILIISIIAMMSIISKLTVKLFSTKLIPINKYYGISKDSQTPVKLKK